MPGFFDFCRVLDRECQQLLHGAARNTLDKPHTVRTQPSHVEVESKSVRFQLPPVSAAVITILTM
jgi:hypothetical protein